jgi:hypothetical protein
VGGVVVARNGRTSYTSTRGGARFVLSPDVGFRFAGYVDGEGHFAIIRRQRPRDRWPIYTCSFAPHIRDDERGRYARWLGCDSIDGTQFSWFRDTKLPAYLNALRQEMIV